MKFVDDDDDGNDVCASCVKDQILSVVSRILNYCNNKIAFQLKADHLQSKYRCTFLLCHSVCHFRSALGSATLGRLPWLLLVDSVIV